MSLFWQSPTSSQCIIIREETEGKKKSTGSYLRSSLLKFSIIFKAQSYYAFNTLRQLTVL